MKMFRYLPILALTGFMPLPAHAILIGFEAAESYQAGEIVGQPDNGATANPAVDGNWTGTIGIGTVETTGGNPTGHLDITHDGTTGDNFGAVNFAPSSTDLGGATFPQSIDFSFDLRLDSYDGTTNTNFGTIRFLRDASGANQASALRLGLSFNGSVQIVSGTFGGGNTNIATFSNSTSWVTFSGTADFTNQQTTLSINGNPVNSGNPFAFANPSGTGSDEYGIVNVSVSNLAGTYSLDNISLQVVPEPSSFAMLLGGFGMLVGFQRRRRSS